MKRKVRLTESYLYKIVKESVNQFIQWFAGSKVVDKDGKPLLLYHAFESNGFDGSYDSGLVFYTTDYNYACEFGDIVDSGYLKLLNPYITKDGKLRKKDGTVIIDEDGYEMTTGYLDALSDDDLCYFTDNYDGVISEDGFMVVSFRDNNFYKI